MSIVVLQLQDVKSLRLLLVDFKYLYYIMKRVALRQTQEGWGVFGWVKLAQTHPNSFKCVTHKENLYTSWLAELQTKIA